MPSFCSARAAAFELYPVDPTPTMTFLQHAATCIRGRVSSGWTFFLAGCVSNQSTQAETTNHEQRTGRISFFMTLQQFSVGFCREAAVFFFFNLRANAATSHELTLGSRFPVGVLSGRAGRVPALGEGENFVFCRDRAWWEGATSFPNSGHNTRRKIFSFDDI